MESMDTLRPRWKQSSSGREQVRERAGDEQVAVGGLLVRGERPVAVALSSLQVPATAAFKNEAMREEFRKLTERMTTEQ